jgi:hypothetical protein
VSDDPPVGTAGIDAHQNFADGAPTSTRAGAGRRPTVLHPSRTFARWLELAESGMAALEWPTAISRRSLIGIAEVDPGNWTGS